MHGKVAGYLIRSTGGFRFQYDADYLEKGFPPLSFSLPLRREPYDAMRLHAFFGNLASEGWLRRIQSREQHIDENDEFSLLVHNGADLPGAVTIELQNMH